MQPAGRFDKVIGGQGLNRTTGTRIFSERISRPTVT